MTILCLEDFQGSEQQVYEMANHHFHSEEADIAAYETAATVNSITTINILTYSLQQSPGIWGR
jgi:hypothetical protein